MPVHAKGNRVVEPSGRIARNRRGTALEGGGLRSHAAALRRVRAVNLSELRRRGQRGIPAAPRPKARGRTTTGRRRGRRH